MLHPIAYRLAKDIKYDLSNREREDAKPNMPQRPPLLQRAQNQQHLHNHIDCQKHGAENIHHDEQSHRVIRAQTRPALERNERDGEADDEDQQAADAEQPDGERGAVFVELEAHEAVDHEAERGGAHEAELHRDEVGVGFARAGHDATVDDEGGEGEEGVEVEEGGDFFTACVESILVSLKLFPLAYLFLFDTSRRLYTTYQQQ